MAFASIVDRDYRIQLLPRLFFQALEEGGLPNRHVHMIKKGPILLRAGFQKSLQSRQRALSRVDGDPMHSGIDRFAAPAPRTLNRDRQSPRRKARKKEVQLFFEEGFTFVLAPGLGAAAAPACAGGQKVNLHLNLASSGAVAGGV